MSSVSDRFTRFLNNLAPTDAQKEDGTIKQSGVRASLNIHYYKFSSSSANSFLIGSWAKATRIRPPRDIDLAFELPYSVYEQYQQRLGNKQSQILQEVRD